MAFDEALAERLRVLFKRVPTSAERRMFGGLCFLVSGRMCCGIVGRDLVVRVGPDRHDDALRRPYTRPMDFTGRPMRGFIYVAPTGFRTARSLSQWVERAVRFAGSLPLGPRGRRRPPRRTTAAG